MNEKPTSAPKQRRRTLVSRARILYIIIPLLALALLTTINGLVVRNITIYSNRSLARQYSIEAAANIQININRHFVLVQQVARSATIGRWMANEDDQELKRNAFLELMGHAAFSPETRLMLTVYESRRGYDFCLGLEFENFTYWGELAGCQISQWFYDTRDNEIPFIINMQRDRPGDGDYELLTWVNHRIIYEGEFVGVATIGFNFDDVSEAVFGLYELEHIRGYIIDGEGYVRYDSSSQLQILDEGIPLRPPIPELQDSPELEYHLQRHLLKMQDGIFQAGVYFEGVTRLTTGEHQYASISPIVGTDWSVVILSNPTATLTEFTHVAILITFVAVLAIVVIVSGYMVRRVVIEPLYNLANSVGEITTDDSLTEVFGAERWDEIGDVARAINTMRENLKQAMNKAHLAEIAEEKTKAKSEFLAKVSHEIRTPITTVLGISEIELQSRNMPQNTQRSFSQIYSSARILLGIVNDILDLSKIEAGKMETINEKYEVASLISDSSHISMGYLSNKSIDFRISIDENIPMELCGDALRISQIVGNLLSNAFKFTKSGTVDLVYKHEPEQDGMCRLVVTVKDTGVGMPEEQLQALGRDYTRFHEHSMKGVGGTGLGMSVVKNLVSIMDAQMKIESEVGVGTSVEITIPQKIADPTPLGPDLTDNLQKLEGINIEKRFNFEPEPMPYGKVLVVDDLDINRFIAKELLGFYSLNVDTGGCGETAIEKVKEKMLKNEAYDIVFLDQMMPGMNGNETMQELRKLGYKGAIISFTANVLGRSESFMEDGFDGFISKPIQTKELNKILIKYVREKYPAEIVEEAKKTAQNKDKESSTLDDYMLGDDMQESLQQEFLKTQKDAFSKIKDAIEKGEMKTAHLLAHNLKGMAYLIKEDVLADIAGKVERGLKDGQTPEHNQMQTLEQNLTSVLGNIKLLEAPELISGNEREKVAALFDRIEPLLESSNSQCLDYVKELKTMPEAAILIRRLEDFDFEAALSDLKILREILLGS